MSDCTAITPISAFMSTNLNSKITNYSRLSDRIVRQLGAPLINIEAHVDQINENISIACEMFTKYAGYTEEYLVFDSNLYDLKKGIRLDLLFSITPNFSRVTDPQPALYPCISSINASTFTATTLSATYPNGIFINQILTLADYTSAINAVPTLTSSFVQSYTPQTKYDNTFDYDVSDYRKVIDVHDIEEGSSANINTLFTIEQSLAQQTYFSYAMGNYGFDLVSWYVLKDWMKIREKMLALRRSYTFDPRTQVMNITPAPGSSLSKGRFYAIIACYVERPLRDIIKEMWVQQYALALTKISVGNVRGKYQGTTLFGGGVLSTDLLTQGLTEKDKLEQQLFTGASPGFGDAMPPLFFVG
jgi:hypothetical protein